MTKDTQKDFYWLNKDSRKFLSRDYLMDGQTAEERVKVIADHAEKLTGIEGFSDKFFNYMAKGYYSLSSPVWSNYGTDRGLPVSCFGSYLEDNMPSILLTHAEVGMLSKFGGGTSGYFGALRPRGAVIKGNGASSGSVHFMELFDKLANVVSQGSMRRGYFSAYLPIDHDDFYEFIGIGAIGHPIQNITHGVSVTDDFMKRMVDGDKEARKRWAAVIKQRGEVGFPYIFFHDTVNNNKPEVFKDKTIWASNMCVHPDTLVLTKTGYATIASLKDKQIELWNGFEFTDTVVRQTGNNQEMLKVAFSDGSNLVCTPYHKFFIKGKVKRTYELVVGDKLDKWDLPVLDVASESTDRQMYTQGFYSAEGNTGYKWSWLYKPKAVCESRLLGTFSSSFDKYNRKRWAHGELDKDFVPFNTYSAQDKLSWLAGVLDGDGTTNKSKNGTAIQLTSVNLKFLQAVKLLLSSIGSHSCITLIRHEGNHLLPDGKDGLKNYVCQNVYRLCISAFECSKLVDLGLRCERLAICGTKPQRNASYFVKVDSVEKVENADSYCFTDTLKNKGWFNGVVTGQCSEIALPSSDDESFVCVLSSMNLVKYDEWKDTDAVETMIIFLDSVCTEFVDKVAALAQDAKEGWLGAMLVKRAVDFCHRWRALGLGVLGWHSYLQSKMIPFESREAAKLNLEIFKFMRQRAEEASKSLTEDGTQKNATLMAVAPTKSSSFILGGVSQGVEPELSNFYIKDLSKIKVTVKNPYLEALLKEKGENTKEVWESIAQADGSVQHLDFLTDTEKGVFKTFIEISPEAVINQAAVRQTYIDQAQSINLMIHPNTPTKDINRLYIMAWELGLKTLYYQHSINAAQAAKREKFVSQGCAACEA